MGEANGAPSLLARSLWLSHGPEVRSSPRFANGSNLQRKTGYQYFDA